MVEELQLVTANPMTSYEPIITLVILLAIIIYGVILLIKSRENQSKSLKAGILIPLIIFILGIVWWIGDNVLNNILGFDFDGYILIAIIFWGIPASILSIIFSAIYLSKSENKTLPTLTIVYGIIYFIISLIAILNFKGM
jgi:hypothetical protein